MQIFKAEAEQDLQFEPVHCLQILLSRTYPRGQNLQLPVHVVEAIQLLAAELYAYPPTHEVHFVGSVLRQETHGYIQF